MPAEHCRNPLLGRLSLLLLMGVAGCSVSPVESPRLAVSGATPGALAVADVEQWVRMGRSSFASGDVRTAIGLLEQALAHDAGHREAALLLGHAHLAVGAPHEAGTAFGRVLRRNGADREAGIGYAKAMLAIGRSEAALEHLQPLTRGSPSDVEALNLEGVALDMQGQHGRAIEIYRRALALDPKASNVDSNLGLSLALAGRHDEALLVLEPLAEGYLSSPRYRQNLALAHGLAGSFDEAERWSRVDLGDADVENNMRYLRLMRGLAPGAVRSAALRPEFVQPGLVEAAPLPPLAAPQPAATVIQSPAAAVPEPAPPARPARLGPPRDLVRPPPPAAPGERPPATVSPRAGFTANDMVIAGIGVEVPSIGNWFVDLGAISMADWRDLQENHRAATAGLLRLSSGDEAGGPFIVGPLSTAGDADSFCRELAQSLSHCTAIRL